VAGQAIHSPTASLIALAVITTARPASPKLLRLRELYETHISHIHQVLFGAAPPSGGGFLNLPKDVENECEQAVIGVLQRHLNKVNRALVNH
jgi:hypothetical protein